MIPIGPIITELAEQMNNPAGTADDKYLALVKTKLNEAYREIAGAWPWQTLKAEQTLTAGEYIVPTDSRIIVKVKDELRRDYHYVEGANRESVYNFNWYFRPPISEPLAEGGSASIGDYSVNITSSQEFPDTDCSGEYIRIADNPGFYRIAEWVDNSNMVLERNFRGNSLSQVRFEIRPRGTEVLGFSNAFGQELPDPVGLTVTYIKHALPVHRAEDVLELPGSCQAVSIKALQKLLALQGFNQAADRLNDRYIAALTEMKSGTPQEAPISRTTLFQTRIPSRLPGRHTRGLSLLNM